jgi:hypothetical protein
MHNKSIFEKQGNAKHKIQGVGKDGEEHTNWRLGAGGGQGWSFCSASWLSCHKTILKIRWGGSLRNAPSDLSDSRKVCAF